MRRILYIGIAIAPVIGGVFLFSVQILNAQRIIHGVHVGKHNLGRLQPNEAHTRLEHTEEALLETPLTLRTPEHTFTATPRELGVDIDVHETLSLAWRQGRSGETAKDLTVQASLTVAPHTFPATVHFDDTKFHQTLDTLLTELDDHARDAALQWNAQRNTFEEVPAESGSVINREAIKETLLEHAMTLTEPAPIALRHIQDVPEITATHLPPLRVQAEELLLRAPLTLTADDISFTVDTDTLAGFLEIGSAQEGPTLMLNPQPVKTFLETRVAPRVNRDPVNAKFEVRNGRVTTFALAKKGRTLDIESAKKAIQDALFTSTENTVPLPVLTQAPEINESDAEELGITTLLAVGESDFAGSPANRIHNIRVGASRYHGVLIAPGEEFSFNELLGPVNARTGYKAELVIKRGETVPEYGGGLCQVSTTAFRAAVHAGLDITERRSHSYIVRYYGTPGFDATIYPPHPDLRFANNTSGYILIQTVVKGTKLYFEFYGNDDGREVIVGKPYVYDQKPDGSAKATLTVKTAFPNGEVEEQTFRSTYKSPNLYPVSRRNPLE